MNNPNVTLVDKTRRMIGTRFTWRMLLHGSAIANIIVLAAMGVVLRDRLPLGLALGIALGLWLLHFRGGLPGILLLGLIFADTTFWTLTAAITNVIQGEEFIRLLIPAMLAAISGAGVIAACANFIWRKKSEKATTATLIVGLGALAFFILIMAAGLIRGNGQVVAARPTDLALKTENMAFSTTELIAKSGEITIEVDNRDLWWHTFTIDALGVDLRIPSSAKQQITFAAQPGTYTYHCAIPGHAALGMQGTLIVR